MSPCTPRRSPGKEARSQWGSLPDELLQVLRCRTAAAAITAPPLTAPPPNPPHPICAVSVRPPAVPALRA